MAVIRWPLFRKQYCTFRVGQFRELHDLRDLHMLPYMSYLHILDNFQEFGSQKINYGPSPTNPFITMNNDKLLVTNVGFPVDGLAPIVTNRMIIVNSGLQTKFNQFRQQMMPRVMFFPDIKDLPGRPGAQRIVNYNALFRARMNGIRRKPRFFNMLLATVLNTICKVQDGLHFIHIPLEALTFQRTDFAKVFRKYDRIATKYPECASYLFLAHLYSILMKPMTLPPRGMTVEDEEGDNAVSTEGLELDPADTFDVSSEEFFNNIFNYVLEDPETAMEALTLKDTENPYKLSVFEYLPPRMLEHINIILTCGGQYIIYNLRDLKELNGKSGAGLVRIIRHINLLAACGEQGTIHSAEEPMVAESIVDVDRTGTKANQPEFNQPMTSEEKELAINQDMAELDNIDKIIEETVSKSRETPLTPAQKQYVDEIGKTYKHLEIGGKSFQQVLTTVPQVDLTVPEVDIKEPIQSTVATNQTGSRTAALDANYVQNSLEKDLASIVTSFNKQGMFLVDFKEQEFVDDLNAKKVYTATYKDANHKQHKVSFTIPKLDEFGRFRDNGSYKTINKQRVSNPITKASDTRVTLNSNYNKMLVQRNENAAHSFWNWFQNAMRKAEAGGFKMMPVHGSCSFPMVALPFELTEIGNKFTRIGFADGMMCLDIVNRGQFVPQVYRTFCLEGEKSDGVWFGYKGDDQFFIDVTGLISVRNAKTGQETMSGAFIDFFHWLTGVEVNSVVEHTDLTILNRTVPLILPLAYRYTLTGMLKYTGADYDIVDAGTRVETRRSDIVVKFSDKKLIIRRTPRNNALLFGGLTRFDFSNVLLEDMDDKDVYYEMLIQRKISPNLIKGIDAMFDLFIDPITRDVLREMKEPTDIRDLLLRANTMLTTSEHKPAASASNFRIRGVEQISGIVYNELAKAFASFKARQGSLNNFCISEYQIKQRIAKEQLVENVAVINPMMDIKTYSKISNGGSGGRSDETFKIPDRQFTKDQLGVISEATVDNGKTGYNAILPFDPLIVNDRGMAVDDPNRAAQLQPENMLSLPSLVMPQVTCDDGKRKFVRLPAAMLVE